MYNWTALFINYLSSLVLKSEPLFCQTKWGTNGIRWHHIDNLLFFVACRNRNPSDQTEHVAWWMDEGDNYNWTKLHVKIYLAKTAVRKNCMIAVFLYYDPYFTCCLNRTEMMLPFWYSVHSSSTPITLPFNYSLDISITTSTSRSGNTFLTVGSTSILADQQMEWWTIFHIVR